MQLEENFLIPSWRVPLLGFVTGFWDCQALLGFREKRRNAKSRQLEIHEENCVPTEEEVERAAVVVVVVVVVVVSLLAAVLLVLQNLHKQEKHYQYERRQGYGYFTLNVIQKMVYVPGCPGCQVQAVVITCTTKTQVF